MRSCSRAVLGGFHRVEARVEAHHQFRAPGVESGLSDPFLGNDLLVAQTLGVAHCQPRDAAQRRSVERQHRGQFGCHGLSCSPCVFSEPGMGWSRWMAGQVRLGVERAQEVVFGDDLVGEFLQGKEFTQQGHFFGFQA